MFGIPFHRSIDRDSCHEALPRISGDSIWLSNPAPGFWKSTGLTLGGIVAMSVAAFPAMYNRE